MRPHVFPQQIGKPSSDWRALTFGTDRTSHICTRMISCAGGWTNIAPREGALMPNRSIDTDAKRRSAASPLHFPPVAVHLRRWTAEH